MHAQAGLHLVEGQGDRVQFPPMHYDGRTFLPGQASNFYIFPAIGMAIYATQAKRVTDEMFIEAAKPLRIRCRIRF
jgi:malic enzyme